MLSILCSIYFCLRPKHHGDKLYKVKMKKLDEMVNFVQRFSMFDFNPLFLEYDEMVEITQWNVESVDTKTVVEYLREPFVILMCLLPT